ncbi:MAG: Trp family transcriptional regulator [Patescibacteria group bacterium]|nr:Trp family transcriptional regulator [Patescibacteria group bacterium]
MQTFSASKKEKQGIILDFIYGFVLCKNIDEAVIFLGDILTKKELEILSRRLRIAKLLIEGKDYREIQEQVHVSHGTIAKIAMWLNEKGEGFRKVVQRLPKEAKNKDLMGESFWEDVKRKYPNYFLPERIIEGILKEYNTQKERKTRESINNLEVSLSEKREINKQVEKQYRKT